MHLTPVTKLNKHNRIVQLLQMLES